MSKIKAGDRIRVYDRQFQYTGIVTEIDDQNIVNFTKYNYGPSYSAHIKQCRKLVKKNTLRSRVDVVLRYCNPYTETTWAARVVGYLLGCDFKDAPQKLKEYFEKKNENKS